MVFPPFFKLSLNFAVRSSWSEPVSSRSCFYWLYRASPSLAARNIINLILVLSIWWCPCILLSLILLEENVCYDQYIALLHFVLQGQTCLFSLDFLLLYSSLLWGKGHPFLLLVLEGVLGLHKTSQLQLLWHQLLQHRLGLL